MLVRIDRLIYRAKFAAAHESAVGTFRTWHDVRLESVMRSETDVRQRLRIADTAMRYLTQECLEAASHAILYAVVPANAGTHTPRLIKWGDGLATFCYNNRRRLWVPAFAGTT